MIEEWIPIHVNEIVNGKRAVSPDFALDLSKVLGALAKMWVRMQADFDLCILQFYRLFWETAVV